MQVAGPVQKELPRNRYQDVARHCVDNTRTVSAAYLPALVPLTALVLSGSSSRSLLAQGGRGSMRPKSLGGQKLDVLLRSWVDEAADPRPRLAKNAAFLSAADKDLLCSMCLPPTQQPATASNRTIIRHRTAAGLADFF